MSTTKLRSFINGISSLRFLGIKNYVIIDINEHHANVGLIKISDTSLKSIYSRQIPQYKIISSRFCELNEGGQYLQRELKLLYEHNKIKNSALVLSVNKYKYFTISLPKDRDEEFSVEELIRKQLPANLITKEFIMDFLLISYEESVENYLVTITRRQDIEKYLELIPKELTQITFVIPFIFSFASQNIEHKKNESLIEIHNERIVYYSIDRQQKINEIEYYLNQENVVSEEETKSQLVITIKTILENQVGFIRDDIESSSRFFIQTSLEHSMLADKVMRQVDIEEENKIDYKISQNFKIGMIVSSLFNDTVFNFDFSKHFKQDKQFDIERVITTKILIMSFSILLLSLLLLNGINMLTDNELSELAYQTQTNKELELNIKKTVEKNEQLKSDLISLNKFKNKNETTSSVLRILSECSLDEMNLTELKLNKNNSGNYDVKLSGESNSKEVVINYIRNLEGISKLNKVELILLDKKKPSFDKKQTSSYPFIFAVNLIYNANKNS